MAPGRDFGIVHSARAENQPDGHRYRVSFRSPPDAGARAAIANAFERALARRGALAAPGDPWKWTASHATLHVVEGPRVGDFVDDGFRAFFADVERVLGAIHRVAPLTAATSTRVARGAIDPAFEAARRDTHEGRARRSAGPLVLAPAPGLARPMLPAALARRFGFVVASRRTEDGAWFVLVPANEEPGAPVVVRIVEPDGVERRSSPLPWGKFPSLASATDGRFAVVTSTIVDAPHTGAFRPCLFRVDRATAALAPLGAIANVGPNQLAAVACVSGERLVVVTERGVALTDASAQRTLHFAPCAGGRAVAATRSGAHVLVACADGTTRARVYEVGDAALASLADFDVEGSPWSDGESLLLSEYEGSRQWRVEGLPAKRTRRAVGVTL